MGLVSFSMVVNGYNENWVFGYVIWYGDFYGEGFSGKCIQFIFNFFIKLWIKLSYVVKIIMLLIM